jgi:mannose-1-phosphate guanylyltransferase
MKAFLLAAGEGTRLRPLTDNTPKCLLPVRGVPMLKIWLDLCALFGIDEVLVNVHAHADQVKQFLRDSPAQSKVTVFEETHLLGSAGTLRANRAWVGSDDLFWVLYADVLTTARLSNIAAVQRRHDLMATIGVYEVANPSSCGIVQVDPEGVVTGFVEKPKQPVGNLAFSGLLLAKSTVLDMIPDRYPADIGFDVLPQLIHRMSAYCLTDEYLIDMGTLSNYDKAQVQWPGLMNSKVEGVYPAC